MTTKQHKKLHLDVGVDGSKYASVVIYDLVFNNNGFLVNVFNEYGSSVSKNSACWEYFDNMYNHL